MTADQQKAAGNEAFRLRDYEAAVQHYTAAIQGLDASQDPLGAPQDKSLHVALLSNRSLALFRLGQYAAATYDAQAVLKLQPGHTKSAFRAAAGQLALGDAAAALDILEAAHVAAPEAEHGADMPAGWAALKVHAAAQAAHNKHRAGLGAAGNQLEQGQHQMLQAQVSEVVAELAAEAGGEADADPVSLLQQLSSLLSGCTDQDAAAEAAAALEAPECLCYPLLLFHLASHSSNCAQAAADALQAIAVAASAGSSAVLWPNTVWLRLVATAVDCSAGSAGAVAGMQLLGWAAGRDEWVRHILLHPLPNSSSGDAGRSPIEQMLSLLEDGSRVAEAAPGAIVAAAQLLQRYASDVAGTKEAQLQLPCRPLLPLLRAAAAAPGMAAFWQEGDSNGTAGDALEDSIPDSGPAGESPAGDSAIANAPVSASAPDVSSMTAAQYERYALEQLRRKRRQVFVPELVAVRARLLAAAGALAAANRQLVLAEAVEEKEKEKEKEKEQQGNGGSSDSKKKTIVPSAFLKEMLALVWELHGQQPRRTAAVLGDDGAPQTYTKRRFAADFKDNPAGDYLMSIDMQESTKQRVIALQQGKAAAGSRTQLELALDLLLHTVTAGASPAALLYRLGMFRLCRELVNYCPGPVVEAGQRLYAAVTDRVPAAAEQILKGGEVPALAALFLRSTIAKHRAGVAASLSAACPTCCGDDFALLTGAGGTSSAAVSSAVVYQAWQLAQGAGSSLKQEEAAAGSGIDQGLCKAARNLVRRCCKRAQKQQVLAPTVPPSGGAWAAIDRKELQRMLVEQQRSKQAGASMAPQQRAQPGTKKTSSEQGNSLVGTPAAVAATTRPAQRQEASGGAAGPAGSLAGTPAGFASGATGATATHSYKSGSVLIEELPPDSEAPLSTGEGIHPAPPAPPLPPQPKPPAATCSPDSSEEGRAWMSAGLTAEEEEVVRVRAEWLAAPAAQKVRWDQTSEEVAVKIMLPAGAKASEVQVTVESTRLTVSMVWCGPVLDGVLYGSVKAKEMLWWLEEGEVHVLLAKKAPGWWKSLSAVGQD